MTIAVTQDDITLGIACFHSQCPVALALKRHFRYVSIGPSLASLGDRRGGFTHHPLPPNAKSFISDFDMGRICLPFSFDLALEGTAQPLPVS